MMTEIQARKGQGLHDLIKRMSIGTIEDRKRTAVTGSSQFQSALQKFEEMLKTDVDSMEEATIIQESPEILTPNEINIFVQAAISYEHIPWYESHLGHFVTRLIQNSYGANHNDFILKMNLSKPINYLGESAWMAQKEKSPRIQGTADNPLKITVLGDVENVFGKGSEYAHYTLYGRAGIYCASFIDHCRFSLFESVEENLATGAKNSEFFLDGKIVPTLFQDKEKPENCIFRTPKKDTLQSLLSTMPEGNRIIYVKADGTEEVVRDYHDQT